MGRTKKEASRLPPLTGGAISATWESSALPHLPQLGLKYASSAAPICLTSTCIGDYLHPGLRHPGLGTRVKHHKSAAAGPRVELKTAAPPAPERSENPGTSMTCREAPNLAPHDQRRRSPVPPVGSRQAVRLRVSRLRLLLRSPPWKSELRRRRSTPT